MYNTFIFQPLYNGLVGLMDLIPWADVGVAVIIFTVVVKLALFHLSKASILTQVRMKEIEPEANKIKAQYANDKQAQALKIMELYKQKGIKPFSGILLLIIQLPILLGLLSVFYKIIPTINSSYLYSPYIYAIPVHTMFLGLINLTKPSLILAIITAVAQFIQLQFSLASKQFKPVTAPASSGTPPLDFADSMNKQMKYMLPLLAFASVYWIVSTLFTLGQELVIRKRYLKK